MSPEKIYSDLRNAVCITSDIEAAGNAYATLGTIENVRECLKIALTDERYGKYVIDFLVNSKRRDSEKTPVVLRHINLRKMIDEIEMRDSIRIYPSKEIKPEGILDKSR